MGHAIANSIVVAAVNRVGVEKRHDLLGRFVRLRPVREGAGPGRGQGAGVGGCCDLDLGRDIERGWGFLRNRKPLTYKGLVRVEMNGLADACPRGSRMPAEWEKHDGTWLAWPKDPLTFPEEILGRSRRPTRSMVAALAWASE